MSQLQFALDPAPNPVAASTERRIDVTLDRLRADFEALSDAERSELVCRPWWAAIDTVAYLRSMERAEEEVIGRPRDGLADIYDRLVTPGEHAGEALLRVFRAMCEAQT
jgi:hypothetical protein